MNAESRIPETQDLDRIRLPLPATKSKIGCTPNTFVCRDIERKLPWRRNEKLTRGGNVASKGDVTLLRDTRFRFRLAQVSLGAVLLATAAHGQSPAQPAPSNVVSNTNEPIEPAVKPNRGAIAEIPSAAIAVDPASLLPDLPPVPGNKATMIGGTIHRLDRVRDQVTLNVFGGGHTTILFDPRTKVYRGTKEVSIADLHEGERAYVDTILDGTTVFARAIRLSATKASGESQGVVLRYKPDRGELTIRDGISPNPIRVLVNGSTKVLEGGRSLQVNSLQEGSLVSVKFSPEGSGHDVASEISILAAPGSRFTFSGQVLHLDLRSGLLVLKSSIDQKTYEIYLDPATPPENNLQTGADVTVVANYQNSRYVARNISLNSSK